MQKAVHCVMPAGSASEVPALVPSTTARTLILGIDKAGRILQHDRNAAEVLSNAPGALLGVELGSLLTVPAQLPLLNLAPAPPEPAALLASGVDWLVVNETEAAAILGRPVAGLAAARDAAGDLRGLGAGSAVVTAGSAGAALATRAGAEAVAGLRVRSVDAVGAGDAFVAALGVALAAGIPAAEAVRAACAAGATATTRRGTQDALPRPASIRAATGVRWPLDSDQ